MGTADRMRSLDDIADVYAPPGPIPLDKVMYRFDRHIGAFMEAATFALVNVRNRQGRQVALVLGGAPGFARVMDPLTATVEIDEDSWPTGDLERDGTYDAGFLFIVPGIKETLRMKGHLSIAPGKTPTSLEAALALENTFFHCAKALIRSHVWDPKAQSSRWSGLRAFKCVEKTRDSSVITSFHLQPIDGASLPDFVPGQHVAIEVEDPAAAQPWRRVYSISNRPGADTLRISVKREAEHEAGSAFLHDHIGVGDVINLRRPTGSFKLDLASRRPLVLLSAGVGLTPMVSMLDHLVATGSERRVWFIHGATCGDHHAMREHVRGLEASHRNLEVHIAYSRPSEDDVRARLFDTHGRISVDLLKRLLPWDDYDFYVCGPTDFMQSVIDGLVAHSVPPGRIYWEAFATDKPTIVTGSAATPMAGAEADAVVQFQRSGKIVTWESRFSSLLNLAEAAGISAPSSCRSGECFSCMTRIVSGEVRYHEPLEEMPEDGTALICCALPVGDVTLDL